jgi:MFS family permease
MPILSHLVPPAGVVRVLVAANFGRSVGNGILFSVVVLFFTTKIGIPPAQLGIALTIAVGLKVMVSVPAGHVSDVIGARRGALAFVMVQGVLITGYAVADGFVGFLVVACLVNMVEAAADAARGALVAAVVPAGERVSARAFVRSVNNVGISLGAILGGFALTYDSRPLYAGLLVASGALFVVSSLIFLALPPVRPVVKPPGRPRLEVLRDRPFAVFGLVNAVLVTNTGILTVALPIWIAQRTAAPPALYSALLVFNTIMVVLFQVRASRGAEDVRGGARALRRCGVLVAACCVLFALAAGQPAWLAVVFLVAGATAHVLGELLYSAGAWALAYELAPEHAHGQYQGMFGLTSDLGSMVTPVAATVLIIGTGWPGWLLFAVVLLAAGMAAPAVAEWARRNRELAVRPS